MASLVGAVGLLLALALCILCCRRCCGHRLTKAHEWNAHENPHWSDKFTAMGVPYHDAWTQTVGSYTRYVGVLGLRL